MAGPSASFHESVDDLAPATRERHRAVASLMEELEAVDWYDQRIDATADADLAAVLSHNRDEEKEHAAMTLEWLRRHDPGWDEQLRRYLFTDAPLAELAELAEAAEQGAGGAPPGPAASLGIGALRDKEEL